jgi:hypothetical protein
MMAWQRVGKIEFVLNEDFSSNEPRQYSRMSGGAVDNNSGRLVEMAFCPSSISINPALEAKRQHSRAQKMLKMKAREQLQSRLEGKIFLWT